MSYSFGLLKPDCVKRGLEEEIFEIIEQAGFKIIASKYVRLNKEQADIIWSLQDMPFYSRMLEYSTSSDSVAFIAEGENAIDRLTKLVGHYNPAIAEEGTIRKKYATSLMENLIHSVSDEEKFWIEAKLFFEISFC